MERALTDGETPCQKCGERPASGHSAEETGGEYPAGSLCIGCLLAHVRAQDGPQTAESAPQAPQAPPEAPSPSWTDDDEDDSLPIVRTERGDPLEDLVGAERKRAESRLRSLESAYPGIRAEVPFNAGDIDFSEEGIRNGGTTEIVDMAMALEWKGTRIEVRGTHRLSRGSGASFSEREMKRFRDAVSDLTIEAIEEFDYAV